MRGTQKLWGAGLPMPALACVGMLALACVGMFALACTGSEDFELPRGTVMIQGQVVRVEVADHGAARGQGLMGRAGLEPGTGMLFLHQEVERHAYWMKNVSFPIDMVWIAGDRIVDVTDRVPPSPPDTPDGERERYQGRVPYDTVLELPAGYAFAHGFDIGQKVEIEAGESRGKPETSSGD